MENEIIGKVQLLWTLRKKTCWNVLQMTNSLSICVLSQDSSQTETLSWWATLASARWGCKKTLAPWPPQCSRLQKAVMLRTHGRSRTWAPTTLAGVASYQITPLWTLKAPGCTSPRVNWGFCQSGEVWGCTEEEGLWWTWGQIYKIQAGKLCKTVITYSNKLILLQQNMQLKQNCLTLAWKK